MKLELDFSIAELAMLGKLLDMGAAMFVAGEPGFAETQVALSVCQKTLMVVEALPGLEDEQEQETNVYPK